MSLPYSSIDITVGDSQGSLFPDGSVLLVIDYSPLCIDCDKTAIAIQVNPTESIVVVPPGGSVCVSGTYIIHSADKPGTLTTLDSGSSSSHDDHSDCYVVEL